MKGLYGMSSLPQIPKPISGFNYYDKLSMRRDVNVRAYSITTRAPGGKAALVPVRRSCGFSGAADYWLLS